MDKFSLWLCLRHTNLTNKTIVGSESNKTSFWNYMVTQNNSWKRTLEEHVEAAHTMNFSQSNVGSG
jgi:hypothetical protein